MDASDVLRNMLGMPKAEIEAFLGQSTLEEIDAIAEAPSFDALQEILDARADRLAPPEAEGEEEDDG